MEAWEQRGTVTRMLMHGFAKGRGWEFTRCDALSISECETIHTILFGMGDLCRKCGGRGHLAHRCMRPKEAWLETLDQMIDRGKHVDVDRGQGKAAREILAQAAMSFAHTASIAGTGKEGGGGRVAAKKGEASQQGGRAGRREGWRLGCDGCGRAGHSTVVAVRGTRRQGVVA